MENKCYLCERLCKEGSAAFNECEYRKTKSYGCQENRMYEIACTQLAVKFAVKHGWKFEGWVGYFDRQKHNWCEGAGGMAYFSNDEVVAMDDLRADLMMDADPKAYEEYAEESAAEYERAEAEKRQPMYVNYRHWLMGKRHDPYEDSTRYLTEVTKRLKEVRNSLQKQVDEMEEELREQAQKDADDLLSNSDGVF